MPNARQPQRRATTVTITLCCAALPRQAQQVTVTTAAGTTVRQLLLQYASQSDSTDAVSRMAEQAQAGTLQCGIWNARATLDTVLQNGDRLEIYRPLTADPKTARRERFARQGGAKTAGLFSKRRPGAKAGY